MDFKKLKNKGYYIRISKGTFNLKKHISYSVVKNTSKSSKTIACYINLAALRILRDTFGFIVKKDVKETIWLNRSESMDFYTQTKEPLKITWHN